MITKRSKKSGSNQRGEPISIKVLGIESRKPKDNLPTIQEMSGLIKNMYEGQSLIDYLEEISND